MKITKLREFLEKYKLSFLIIFVLTLPYNITINWIGTFSILFFVMGIILNKYKIKELFENSVVRIFFIFMIFYCLSILWGEFNEHSKNDIRDAIDNFKYYPLIILGIFMSGFTSEQIKKALFYLAIAPILYVVFYYTNSLELTSIYSPHYLWDSVEYRFKILMWDFRANPFIIYSAIYFYIKFLHNLKDKKLSFIYLCVSAIFAISLFVDEYTHSRAMAIALVLGITYVSFSFITFRYKYIILTILLGILGSVVTYTQIDEFKKGYSEVKLFMEEKKYEGSFGYRLGMLTAGYEIFERSPYIGSGINNVTDQVKEIKKQNPQLFANFHLESFHNESMLLLVQVGLVGYFLFLFFLIKYFTMRMVDNDLNLLKNSVIIIYSFLTIADYFFTNKTSGTMFAILLAIFITQKYLDIKEKKELEN